MKMIDHNHFICHLILGTFTEYPEKDKVIELKSFIYNKKATSSFRFEVAFFHRETEMLFRI